MPVLDGGVSETVTPCLRALGEQFVTPLAEEQAAAPGPEVYWYVLPCPLPFATDEAPSSMIFVRSGLD